MDEIQYKLAQVVPGAKAWTVDVGDREVKGQGHNRLKLHLDAGGDIILDPLSRVDRGIHWATEMLPFKNGDVAYS